MIYNVHIFDDHDVLKSSLTRLRTSGRAGFNCNLAAFQPDTVSRASEFWWRKNIQYICQAAHIGPEIGQFYMQHAKNPNISLVFVSFIVFLPLYGSYYGKSWNFLSRCPMHPEKRTALFVMLLIKQNFAMLHTQSPVVEAKSARREWSKACAGR